MKRTPAKKHQSIFVAILLTLLFASQANSSTPKQNDWNFKIAAYGWIAGQKGTISPFAKAPEVDIDIDFWDDILGNINGTGFLLGEASKGSVGVFMDIAYINVETDAATAGDLYSSVSAKTISWMLTPAAFYRVIDKPSYFIDLLAGARLWSVDSTIAFKEGTRPRVEVNNSQNWIDPLIGIKGISALGNSKFYFSGTFLIGGFGAGSDLMWDTNLNLGYNWGETFSTIIGYRYMDVDYDKDDFLYDINQNGPIVGCSWRF